MKIFIFTGPTLGANEAREYLDAVYLPPVCQGDVYCAAREKPWGIGIIDGYFERVPSVWHKEILWAMAEGIHVFGSSSMGALRAAELDRFGMVGVGKVFESFDSRDLEDDDEVTVVHGSAEDDYPPYSVAMVNIRATLDAAVAGNVLQAPTAPLISNIAKDIYYPERSWPRIMAEARASQILDTELARLEAWLPEGEVDQKHLDAIEMLKVMARKQVAHPDPLDVSFTFQHTDAWEQVLCRIDRRPLDDTPGRDTYSSDAVLVELQLQGGRYRQELLKATVRAMALELSRSEGHKVNDAELGRAIENFRLQHELLEPGSTEVWLETQGINIEQLDRLLREEVKSERVQAIFNGDKGKFLPTWLRLEGKFADLESRALRKQQLLASNGLDNPGLDHVEPDEEGLWRWYFSERLQLDVPDDMQAWSEGVGFENHHELRRAVLREYLFLELDESDKERVG